MFYSIHSNMYFLSLLLFFGLFGHATLAQSSYWQQEASYTMDINFDVKKHQFEGDQKIQYINHSPDQLDKVFYHLYFNAFQPGSMMDVRSRTIQDADSRVGDRIQSLKQEEQGYQRIRSLTQDGEAVQFEVVGTILEVTLVKPIEPGDTVLFEMKFDAQVPIQIRRSGRDNKEGISYSMTQWYPKMCEYDGQGWHSNPYVGREFYGIWGDFEVNITIDKSYILGGTGIVVNADEIGYGYSDKEIDHSDKKTLTWRFKAENVHDFFWGADPDYIHDVVKINEDLTLHFLYQDDPAIKPVWEKSQEKMVHAFSFIQPRYGAYPYPQYSFIQGGDGGMEYPMGTLITGKRNFGSLVGVMVHELMHTWYQMLMGTNEALHAWMDEGFTSYTSNVVMDHIMDKKEKNPHFRSYRGYYYLALSGVEEPLTTHADHFISNFAYGQAAYSKGAVFLGLLNYIVGQPVFDKAILSYYNTWAFKHPTPNDVIRIFEKESGLELDWFKEYFVQTVKRIDYSIVDVVSSAKTSTDSIVIEAINNEIVQQNIDKKVSGSTISILNKGTMPMPLDVVVTYTKNGKTETACYHIPMRLMRGEKQDENLYDERYIVTDWPWTHPLYQLHIPISIKKIKKVEIDPSKRLADVFEEDNIWKK